LRKVAGLDPDDIVDLRPASMLEVARQRRLERRLKLQRLDISRHGPMAGVIGDHISDKIRVYGRYEVDELEALDSLVLSRFAGRTRCCVDIGANIGNHCLHFSRRFDKVIAFEPNPLAADLLRWNLRANDCTNVTVHPVGLAEIPSTATLAIVDRNLGASHLGARPGPESAGEARVEVQLARGDDLLLQEELIDLVKIDVEGFEHEVLRGLRKTLARHRPIVLAEVLPSRIDPASGTTPVASLLDELGYVPFEMVWRRRSRMKLLDFLLSALHGTRVRVLRPIRRFANRSYPMVVFIPREDVRLLRQDSASGVRQRHETAVST
jgi:FkbM family methyltransferase